MNVAQQTAEHRINPSEEVIRLGPLMVHFLVTGDNSLGSVAVLVFEVTVAGGARLMAPAHSPISIDDARTDGSGLHVLLKNSPGGRLCCARWTPDGRYIFYQNRHEGRSDLWALPMQSGLGRLPRSYSG
jgi:hypothetical protein